MPVAAKSQRPVRRVRTLNLGEEKEHFGMLNLAFDTWGNEEEWRRKYIQPGFDVKSNILIVEDDGKWVGGGTAWFRDALLRAEKKIKVYVAGDLYVHPDFRGKGVYSTAMESLNKMAKTRGAVLAFAFPSVYRLPSVALPRYGFVTITYPKTRLLILNPEKFLSWVLPEVKEVYLPSKFNGMTIKLIVRFVSSAGKHSITKIFRVERGTLLESKETEKIEFTVTMNVATLLKISSLFYLGKKALFASLFWAMLRRQIGVRFSLRFLRAVLGI